METTDEYWRYVEAAAETAHEYRHGEDADNIPAILARNSIWTRDTGRALVVLQTSGSRSAVLGSADLVRLEASDGATLADLVREAAALALADDIARGARKYAWEAGE